MSSFFHSINGPLSFLLCILPHHRSDLEGDARSSAHERWFHGRVIGEKCGRYYGFPMLLAV